MVGNITIRKVSEVCIYMSTQSVDGVFAGLEAAYRHRQYVTYLSGPVTGGPRYLRSLADLNISTEDIIEQNLKALHDAEAALHHDDLASEVINPARLNVSGWTQQQYMELWTRVVRELVREVICLPGYALSAGCVEEVRLALSLDIPVRMLGDGGVLRSISCADISAEAVQCILHLEAALSINSIDRAKFLAKVIKAYIAPVP